MWQLCWAVVVVLCGLLLMFPGYWCFLVVGALPLGCCVVVGVVYWGCVVVGWCFCRVVFDCCLELLLCLVIGLLLCQVVFECCCCVRVV